MPPSDAEEGGTETKVEPPLFCPFSFLVSGCCFLCREPSSLASLFFFWPAGTLFFCLFLFFYLSFFNYKHFAQSNLPTHLSRTRGLGWLRLWRGLLHREFVQLARNTEPALIWSRSLCCTSFCYILFLKADDNFISFLFLFKKNLTSVQSSHLSALPYVYHEYTIHSVSQGPVWADNVLYHFFITREGRLSILCEE